VVDVSLGTSANPGLGQPSSRHRTPQAVTMNFALAVVEVRVFNGHLLGFSFITKNSEPTSTGGHAPCDSFGFFDASTELVERSSFNVGITAAAIVRRSCNWCFKLPTEIPDWWNYYRRRYLIGGTYLPLSDPQKT